LPFPWLDMPGRPRLEPVEVLLAEGSRVSNTPPAAPSLREVARALSVEEWAAAYVLSTDLNYKQAPPRPPSKWSPEDAPAAPPAPGRPSSLELTLAKPKTVRRGALKDPEARARLLHTFWHHELQAAELMCWAILRFADQAPAFRRGLLGIAQDEIRHMHLYRQRIEALGHRVGDFPVRDWFWERVPTCQSPAEFVALLGMGLEAANLEHAPRFASYFADAGDLEGARVQEQIEREERRHVRFAVGWFRHFTGKDDFDTWRMSLPPPLTPLLFRGRHINREGRLEANMSVDFIDRLEAWRP
jgi:uncharacterized ferritin-like protein (DUF455 family)